MTAAETPRPRRGLLARHWWAQAWNRLLTEAGLPDRLQRGRGFARAGQVFELRIDPGTISGQVRPPKGPPFRSTIQIGTLTEGQHQQLVEELSLKAAHGASLLRGQLEPELEQVWSDRGIPLLPEKWTELALRCECDDPASPCPHAAAVLYLAIERIDRDPFLLLRLRGCERDLLLSECREKRAAAARSEIVEPSPDLEGWADPRFENTGSEKRDPGEPTSAAPPGTSEAEPPATERSRTDRSHPPPAGNRAGMEFWGDAAMLERLDQKLDAVSASGPSSAVLNELGLPPRVDPDTISELALREAYDLARESARDLLQPGQDGEP